MSSEPSETTTLFEASDEALTPMMRQYADIKAKHPDCLLFYRLGDFFELFFDDAVTASRELGIALTKRGRQKGQGVPMCGVPAHAYEVYLAKLIQKGYRIAVCDQTETPEEAKKRGAKGPLARDITRIVTSGTLTEDRLLPTGNNYIAALSLPSPNKTQVALAIADISTGFFGLEEHPLRDLDNALTRWHPTEIIVSDTLFDLAELSSLWESWQSALTLLPKARFSVENAEHVLNSVYNTTTLDVFGALTPLEVQAAGILVDYVMTTQCTRTLSLSPPRLLQSSEFMMIDASTRRNLELTATASSHQRSTLFATIDRTVTPMGRRLLFKWLSAPLLQIPKINQRLDDVDIFVQEAPLRQALRSDLEGVPDIERILARVVLARSGPRDLGALRTALEKACDVQELLERAAVSVSQKPTLSEAMLQLLQTLTKALKKELPLLMRDGDYICDGYDADLDEHRLLRDHVNERLHQLQVEYIQKTGIHTLKIRRNNVWGVYAEVSAGQISKVPFDFVHRQTLTNYTRYTTAELSLLDRKIEHAEISALRRENELFLQLREDVLAVKDDLLALASVLAYLDVVSGGGELASAHHYTRPEFCESPSLDIIAGRHPILDQTSQQQGTPFVANDCQMDAQTRRFLLLTGPNMAGKSTYLRQNALIIIMAQMGYFVPAQKARLGLVDKLFSRIGASDDLAAGRSTFMMEMIETAAILHQATPQSFVILDEIGRGTATYDGLAIAWSVSEFLYKKLQSRTLFATHYHELAQLATVFPAFCTLTASTQEWDDKIIFLHKIVDGSSAKSYGIHVARLAGLPKTVIHRAQEILTTMEKNFAVPPTKMEKITSQIAESCQRELF